MDLECGEVPALWVRQVEVVSAQVLPAGAAPSATPDSRRGGYSWCGNVLFAEIFEDGRVVADELGVRFDRRELHSTACQSFSYPERLFPDRRTSGSLLTVGTYSNVRPEPTVPSPMANFAMFTGGLSKPKYAFIM